MDFNQNITSVPINTTTTVQAVKGANHESRGRQKKEGKPKEKREQDTVLLSTNNNSSENEIEPEKNKLNLPQYQGQAENIGGKIDIVIQ